MGKAITDNKGQRPGSGQPYGKHHPVFPPYPHDYSLYSLKLFPEPPQAEAEQRAS